MTILTVELDKERDLPAIQALLTNMGLKFSVEEDEDDWADLSEDAVDGIKAGLEDFKVGRVYTHEYVMDRINKKLGNQ